MRSARVPEVETPPPGIPDVGSTESSGREKARVVEAAACGLEGVRTALEESNMYKKREATVKH